MQGHPGGGPLNFIINTIIINIIIIFAINYVYMKNGQTSNPFVIGKYIPEEYFCDRKDETRLLIKHIENGRNVALISPRRMGKTGLILHCFRQPEISERYHTFFVDIYATSSLAEFVYVFSKEVYAKLKSKKETFNERFFQIISSLRVGFKVDPLTGAPGFDIGLGDIRTPETTLDQIFEYLEIADKPCLVCIDEFQQIGEYREKNIEALLRTKIQHCRQTSFIFTGSKRHLMSQMFHSSAKPFYQSAISMGLEPIPMNIYSDFAVGLFKKFNRSIEKTTIEEVYSQFNGCTWFVQMMMNELFALTTEKGVCRYDQIPVAWDNIIMTQESSYKDILLQLSPKQKALIQAIAKEGTVSSITSSEFINRHSLASASSVQAAMKPLLTNNIITQENGSIRIYDYFFSEWMKRKF